MAELIVERWLQDLVGNETLGNSTTSPSLAPSLAPSLSVVPSDIPSFAPSDYPTPLPSETPSKVPTGAPSDFPSQKPSQMPTRTPLTTGNQDEALRNTLQIYAPLYAVVLIMFCYLRRKYPRVYNIRNWVPKLKTDLAKEQFGYFSWIWKISSIEDIDMMDQCGMDAICFVRILEFGFRMSIVGVLMSLILMLVYKSADESEETANISGAVVTLTTANLPAGSLRLIATVIGAYFIFGFTMYSILQEFEWFIEFRHTFLAKRLPRNYAVYVQGIPIEYQTNAALAEFFSNAYPGSVIDAHLAIEAPGLQKKVAQRDSLIGNLENAISLRELVGEVPQAKNRLARRDSGDTIQGLGDQLQELNSEISKSIDTIIEKTNNPIAVEIPEDSLLMADSFDQDPGGPNSPQGNGVFKFAKKSVRGVTKVATNATKGVTGAVKDVGGAAVNIAGSGANLAMSLIRSEDGTVKSAGFVTFNSLRTVHGALQMIQHPTPHAMIVLEAPQPEDILWKNLGKDKKELQLGKLISYAATVALCLFWTLPMSTIASLSSVAGLSEQFPFVKKMLEDYPFVEGFLAQLGPILVVVLKLLVKVILEQFSYREGPISGAAVEASLFAKLAWFKIIQTFIVQAISSSLVSELSNIASRPEKIIDLLGTSLPTESIYFIQIILVDTVISLSVELLRVSAVSTMFVRKKVGPNQTEKQRNTTWMGIRPLADPLEFEHAEHLSGAVLNFMVFFVYATIAPITSFFVAICFFLKIAVYRHQFVYIYPTFPDSGGHLWVNFFKILPNCMIIGQLALQGMLVLKKQPIANSLMLPLLPINVLFQYYIRQQHFRMTQFLPARIAMFTDQRCTVEGGDFEFIKGKFVQPELRERLKFPENANEEDYRDLAGKDEENMDTGHDDTKKN